MRKCFFILNNNEKQLANNQEKKRKRKLTESFEIKRINHSIDFDFEFKLGLDSIPSSFNAQWLEMNQFPYECGIHFRQIGFTTME